MQLAALSRLTVALGALLCAAIAVAPTRPVAHVNLYADGVAVTPAGIESLPAGTQVHFLPGSRVPTSLAGDPAAINLAEQQRTWLAQAEICGEGGPYQALVTDALLDINTLLEPTPANQESSAPGALVAGWSVRWRYVWPRDSAFGAVALARVGHVQDALDILLFHAGVQSSDGTFAARYLPTGDGVPDSREDQLDGVGWALWATNEVLALISQNAPALLPEAQSLLTPMTQRSVDHLLEVTDNPAALPPASSDYWERSEDHLTLGTAAIVLAGLQSASELAEVIGADTAARAAARAEEVGIALETDFGPGYRRYGSGPLGLDGRDAATAFLLPPFVTNVSGAEAAWRSSILEMARPGGGIAPGATWKQDGISWTPETSLYALTAAELGDVELAETWLTWLDEHRTASGALPEKVLADGSPAAVAPLAWTAANVVLTVCALDAA